MSRALPLKQRVAWFGALLGLSLSTCFAFGAWFMAEDYEHLLVSGVLEAEVESVRIARERGLPVQMPAATQLRGWLIEPGSALPADLPAAWANLPVGIHERPNADTEGLHLAVFEQDGLRLIYAMDLGPVETLEGYLVGLSLLIIVIGGGVSALLARWLAGHALAPLQRLAQAVEALPTHPEPTAFAAGLADDSLGQLATSIDDYQQRLLEAERGERDFFADASHELRSPVASLRGAAEVLLDDPDTPEHQRRRLQRIDRASAELGQLIDALLMTARGDPPLGEPFALRDLLQETCAELQARADARGVQLLLLQSEGVAMPPLSLPRRWLQTALLNLLRALIDQAGTRALRLQMGPDALEVLIDGEGTDDTRSDTGFPLRLAERLCRSMGLRLERIPQGLRLALCGPSLAGTQAGADT